jgi:Domain of unknown function (DUF4158)/Tn3 transposase DDE domain
LATREVFSADELAQLRRFPEPARAELIRHFTLAPADEAFVRKFRGRENVLGAAVQLCTLPWLGFVPDDVPSAPAAAVARLSDRLGIPLGELRGYGARGQTRTDHLREVAAYLGWRQVDAARWKDLEEFLFAWAMEHDSPKLLFRQACEYLSSSRLVRPGVVKILERVATARERARAETWERVAPLLTSQRRADLDSLLAVDPVLGRTRLTWLGAGPASASPAAVKAELEKLAFLRGMDAHTLDLSALPAERRRFLAGVGQRLTAQHLARREDARRYPILLTLAVQSAADVLDEVLLLFDQALPGRESAARARMTEALAERARTGEDRQALLDDILRIVLDPGVADSEVGARLRGGVGHERMRSAWAARRDRLPRDHGHLAMMDASMSYLRQFVPDVLAAVRFDGGPGTGELLRAAGILAGLYASKARKVPDGAPDGFVPARWAGYLETARKAGDVTGFRHYWELCVLMALRDGLRSGDVHVPGSRRYADPASFLLTAQQWEPQRLEFCHLAGKPPAAAGALALARDELHTALSDLESQLARGAGLGELRLSSDGELIIPPLTAEDVPADAAALRVELGAMLPRVPIASVLVEIDARTGFTDHLVHAGGKASRPPELKRNLMYVIIAEATNMGLAAMAESSGVSYDVLAWTAEWYFRGETLEAANAAIVNYHHRLPMAQAFGTGTLSSSDGQKFPVKGRSLTASHLSRYFARGQGIHLHPRLGPALHVRHEGDSGDLPGEPVRARRHPGQPDRPARRRARHRHPRRHAGELRAVRPGGPPALAPHPRPGEDNPLPARASLRLHLALPVLRTPPYPPPERGPGGRHVGRPAARGGLGQGRARHGGAGGREAVLVEAAAERAGLRDQGVRGAAPHGVRRPLPCGRSVQEADRPAAEQGREPARAQAVAGLRQRGGAPPPAPRAAGRADVVPDSCGQRGRHLDQRVQRPGRHRAPPRRPRHRRRRAGPHLAHPPRERPLLRDPLRRRRRRARPA